MNRDLRLETEVAGRIGRIANDDLLFQVHLLGPEQHVLLLTLRSLRVCELHLHIITISIWWHVNTAVVALAV